MENSWYDIKSKKHDCVEIYIYDEIGMWGVSAKDFISELNSLDVSEIMLRISTPGGSVFEGNNIYNALRRHKATITVNIDALAASMGSIIALAGDSVAMAQNGMYMIHNPSSGSHGDAAELRATADLLDTLKSSMLAIYSNKTGLEIDVISEWMDSETWFPADEALEHGFIDEITEKLEAAACFDPEKLKCYRNAPEGLIKKTEPAPAPQPENEPEPAYNHRTPLIARLTEIKLQA